MHAIAAELDGIIDKYLSALQSVSGDAYAFRSAPGKWSKKEIIGHLVDSAQNNIRRFVVAQYDERPRIVYNQDKWVVLANYQQYPLPDLISLWYLLNKHICQVLKSMAPVAGERECQTEDVHTIRWLAQDYIRHLRHHLHQILDL